METKSLLIGIVSFIAGGLLVSVAATTFEKPRRTESSNQTSVSSMQESVDSLKDKTGEDFDQAFINEMIAHHQGAIDMAQLAQTQANHDEIKQLSKEIISAQEKEMQLMKKWQTDWGYSSQESKPEHSTH